jgi:putative ABC transport system permease protein
MIISVLERRSEIGLRRALGATTGRIRVRFLAEAVFLAVAGGTAGVGAGVLSSATFASSKHELVVIPTLAWAGGIGVAAGLWPALRAARMSPTAAPWSIEPAAPKDSPPENCAYAR